MSVFRFKRFEIINQESAMKVNTDGVLLGASVELAVPDAEGKVVQVLDVGTGTGTIALMVGQRLDDLHCTFQIEGIDIDPASAAEASANFSNSPWSGQISAELIDLSDLGTELARARENGASARKFDLIVSNPPYFDSSLRNPELRKNNARHTDCLSYKELLEFSRDNLSAGGRLAMILPSDVENALLRYGRMCSLFPERIIRIRTTPKKAASRIIVQFTGERKDLREEWLTIQDQGQYTGEYTRLVHEFYLWA